MNFSPISAANFDLVADWLAQKENYQWLDFGSGTQSLHPAALKVMTARDTHLIRVFASEPDDVPIGIVALSNVSPTFKTAMLWYVLGDKNYGGQGYTTRAAHQMLRFGFTVLGLQAVNAWTVEANTPSIRILERNNFQLIGRQRKCHLIDGQAFDRLLFDLLAGEHTDECPTDRQRLGSHPFHNLCGALTVVAEDFIAGAGGPFAECIEELAHLHGA